MLEDVQEKLQQSSIWYKLDENVEKLNDTNKKIHLNLNESQREFQKRMDNSRMLWMA